MNIDERQRREAEIWLLTELNQAEQEFGDGEDVDVFAKNYLIKLGSD